MNKTIKIIVGVIVVALIIVYVGLRYMPQGHFLFSNSFRSQENKVVKIGAPLSFTGEGASFGEDLKNGFDLALSEVNKKYPFKMEIIYEDIQSKAEVAVSAVRKLIDVDGVKIILGSDRSNATLAIAPIAESNKVLLLTPISSADKISEAGDYIFRLREGSTPHGMAMAEFLVQKKGIKRIAVFTAKSANAIGQSDVFKKKFQELGGEIVFSADYDEKGDDFRTEIAKMKNSGAEVVYMSNSLGKDAAILANQIRASGYAGLIAGCPVLDTPEFFKSVNTSTAGDIIITASMLDLNDSSVKQYMEKYKAAYGKESNAFSANSYDAVNLIAMAIDQCKGDNSDCIRDFLYGVKNYPGMGGLTTFDKNGDVVKPVMFKTLKDGKFVPLGN